MPGDNEEQDALHELVAMVDKQRKYICEETFKVIAKIQEQNNNDIISTLLLANEQALDQQNKLLKSISHIIDITKFLTYIVQIQNLFNNHYEHMKQEQKVAQENYAPNIIQTYKNKPKPQNQQKSFVLLLFQGVLLYIDGFRNLIEEINTKLKTEKIKFKSTDAVAKSLPRTFFKAYYDSKGDCSNILDILRASFVFDTFDDLYKAFSKIEQIINAKTEAPKNEKIVDGVLRVKDTFTEKVVKSGHRQIIINFYCPGTEMVCELQLHHELFDKYGKETHWLYDRTRLFEVNGNNIAFEYVEKFMRPKLGNKMEYEGGIPVNVHHNKPIKQSQGFSGDDNDDNDDNKIDYDNKNCPNNIEEVIILMKPYTIPQLRLLKPGDMIDYQSSKVNGTWMKAIIMENSPVNANNGQLWLHELGVNPIETIVSGNIQTSIAKPSLSCVPWSDIKECEKVAPLGMFNKQIMKYLLTKLHIKQLKIYDQITVLDNILNNWEPCTVLEIVSNSMFIHYNNWSSAFDAWIDINDYVNNNRLALPFIVKVQPKDHGDVKIEDAKDEEKKAEKNDWAHFDKDFSKPYYVMVHGGKTAQFLKGSNNKKYADYHLFPMCRLTKPITDSNMEITFKTCSSDPWYGIGTKNIEADGFGGYNNNCWLINKNGQMIYNKTWIPNQACCSNITNDIIKLKYNGQEKCIYVTVNRSVFKYQHNDMPNFNDAYFVFSVSAGKIELIDN